MEVVIFLEFLKTVKFFKLKGISQQQKNNKNDSSILWCEF